MAPRKIQPLAPALQQGGGAQLSQLPAGPSLVLAEAAVAATNAAAAAAAAAAPRRRIVVSDAAMEEGLQLAHDGKVSARNAWDVKVLEGMSDSVRAFLASNGGGGGGGGAAGNGGAGSGGGPSGAPNGGDAANASIGSAGGADQYQAFSKAATLVEGGAKVWSHRVESTYLLSNQVVRRLLRNDRGPEADAGADGEGGEGGDAAAAAAAAAAQRRKRRPAARTLADGADEISTDGGPAAVAAAARRAGLNPDAGVGAGGGASAALAAGGSGGGGGGFGAGGFSASFRCLTEQFDQGHAQGLLLNTVRMGDRGDLRFDADWPLANAPTDDAEFAPVVFGDDAAACGAAAAASAPNAVGSPPRLSRPGGADASTATAASPGGRLSQAALDATAASAAAHAVPYAAPFAAVAPDAAAAAQRVASTVGGGASVAGGDVDGWDDAGGDFGDDGDFGGDEPADGGGDGDGNFGDDGDTDGGVGGAAAAARALVSGRHALGRIDAAFAAFGGGGGDGDGDGGDGVGDDPQAWIPLSLSQAAGGQFQVNGGGSGGVAGGIGGIRRLCGVKSVAGRVRSATAAALGADAAPSAKRRRGEKCVRFSGDIAVGAATAEGGAGSGAGDAATTEARAAAAAAERLRLNKTPLSALTPLGAAWLREAQNAGGDTTVRGRSYADVAFARRTAASHGFFDTAAYAAFSATASGSAGDSGGTSANAAALSFGAVEAMAASGDAAVPGSWHRAGAGAGGDGAALAAAIDVRAVVFQPFCCPHKPRWSVLARAGRPGAGGGGGARTAVAMGRGRNGDDGDGDGDGVGEAIFTELPFDVNAVAGGDGDSDGGFGGGGGGDDWDGVGGDDGGYGDGDDGAAPLPRRSDGGGAGGAPATETAAPFLFPSLLSNDGVDDGRPSAAGEPEPPLLAGPAVGSALRLNFATVPTTVDVGRLRRKMWEGAERLLAPSATSALTPMPSASRGGEADGPAATFSALVVETLPHVPQISRDGTLSPAFFFFSLLFLANEKGLELEAAEGNALDDIVVRRV